MSYDERANGIEDRRRAVRAELGRREADRVRASLEAMIERLARSCDDWRELHATTRKRSAIRESVGR